MCELEVASVLSHYTGVLGGASRWCSLGSGGGFSGATLFRVQAADHSEWCLRRWPDEYDAAARLPLMHDALRVAAEQGCSFVPVPHRTNTGGTWVVDGTGTWELTPWMPGESDTSSPARKERVAAAFEALAQLHLRWRAWLPTRGAIPGVQERRRRVAELLAGRLRQLLSAVHAVRLGQRWDQAARDILTAADETLPQLLEPLTRWQSVESVLHPVIRDVKREHVLYLEDKVTGLVDFGTLRIDHPALDLARLMGSYPREQPSVPEIAWPAYQAVAGKLDEFTWELVPLLDRTNRLLGAINWVRWLWLERREFADPELVLQRLLELRDEAGS